MNIIMKKGFYYLLFSAFALLTASTTYGQETIDSEITINGVPLTKKVKSVRLIDETDIVNFSLPSEKVVIVFENSDGKEETEEYYPTIVKQLFGDAVSVRGLRIYDGGEQDGTMSLGGIEPGTKIQVYDTSGKIRRTTVAGEHTTIDLNGLPNGMYVARCGKVAIKIMKR